jgi:hypothetical protein
MIKAQASNPSTVTKKNPWENLKCVLEYSRALGTWPSGHSIVRDMFLLLSCIKTQT